ncbi:MaoC family dehydratase [Roseibacterium beibuensis]|uniref:MaoC family dehydratase n=1 Tax=[Roseibacterium] beibuensis TaxID=1193142 RepID=UPI00217D1BCE|nr:MaoC family dehydratase [Roseibacterium beibuensis]MCS6627312.1 MaoC family dehydratase [Roseibacterium beibuensis]
MADALYLEDLHVGQTFTTGSVTVTAEAIKAFARDYDPQPFHLDEAAAEASLFGGLAASGWHTAALSMRLLVDGLPIAGGLIGVGGETTWPRPTRPGDVLTVHIEVTEITPSKSRSDRGMVRTRNETRNQHGEPVQISNLGIVAWRRPVA